MGAVPHAPQSAGVSAPRCPKQPRKKQRHGGPRASPCPSCLWFGKKREDSPFSRVRVYSRVPPSAWPLPALAKTGTDRLTGSGFRAVGGVQPWPGPGRVQLLVRAVKEEEG